MSRSLPRSTPLLFLAVVFVAPTSAQDFAPFNPESRKLFATLDHSTVFSLAFDSAMVNGDTTVYYNYRSIRDTVVPSDCGWWTGQECRPMDEPTWAGASIKVAANGTHVFHSAFASDDPVILEFSTVPGSETFMHAAIDQEFLMAYDGTTTMTILGQPEVVRQWTILHQDQFGNTIASPLNGAHIRVGENLGLLDFFRVDSFPFVLEPIGLVGQADPPLGLHEITPAVLEDHQPGDEVQFHEVYDMYDGPPWADYDRYRKYVYLTRNDTPDAVIYSVHQEVFNAGETNVTIDTITLTCDRITILGTIPFEQFNGVWPELFETGYCGIPLWTLVQPLNEGVGYCPEENCWGGTDTNGPPAQGALTYAVGLGLFDRDEGILSPDGFDLRHTIVYFKKNGTECFDEVSMGSSGSSAGSPAFELSPNPSDGMMSVSCEKPVAGAEVIDPQGHVITGIVLDAQRGELDMRAVADGLYLVRLRFVDGGVATRRVVIGR